MHCDIVNWLTNIFQINAIDFQMQSNFIETYESNAFDPDGMIWGSCQCPTIFKLNRNDRGIPICHCRISYREVANPREYLVSYSH